METQVNPREPSRGGRLRRPSGAAEGKAREFPGMRRIYCLVGGAKGLCARPRETSGNQGDPTDCQQGDGDLTPSAPAVELNWAVKPECSQKTTLPNVSGRSPARPQVIFSS